MSMDLRSNFVNHESNFVNLAPELGTVIASLTGVSWLMLPSPAPPLSFLRIEPTFEVWDQLEVR